MKSTIMDNAKSDLTVVKMCIEYYNSSREKDIKRHACYHMHCCLKKMFIAILVNNNNYSYEELIDENLVKISTLINKNIYNIPPEILNNIKIIEKWSEEISIFSLDFRQNMDFINKIYDIVTLFFDNLFDKNTVY